MNNTINNPEKIQTTPVCEHSGQGCIQTDVFSAEQELNISRSEIDKAIGGMEYWKMYMEETLDSLIRDMKKARALLA